MKTLDEIKDELAKENGYDTWSDVLWRGGESDEDYDDITERYASQSEELISSLKGEIAELKSEITILKSRKGEN